MMKNINKLALLSILFLIPFFSFSQEARIEINNTSISNPQVYNFKDVTQKVYAKYLIKNNRNSTVVISDIKTPAGFFANISTTDIGAGKQAVLYVGLDPDYVEISGEFEEKIILKTNLIKNIEVTIKGRI